MHSECSINLLYWWIATFTATKGSEYLLDGYECDGDPKENIQNGETYTIQYYRGKHKNEYVMRTSAGDAFLYENGVMKMK